MSHFAKAKIAFLSTLLSASALAGCASTDGIDHENSTYFSEGYADGCRTSTESDKAFSTAIYRDKSLFKNDAGYRAGWRRGYHECRKVRPRTLESDDPFSDDRQRDF